MEEISDPVELRAVLDRRRAAGATIGFVPTMGALHAGHLALAAAARARNAITVMSIFVNPTQFGQNEDLDRYPRDLDRDRSLARDAGVDILYVPTTSTMYPGEQRVWVDPRMLAAHLEGERRPGHFAGVCTVVTKLFHQVWPHRAYFGQKDGQQAIIITAMARDLAFPIEICVEPTVREPDGLALSSRNVYLGQEERAQAASISQGLSRARQAVLAGERDPEALEHLVRERIEHAAPTARVDYVALADLGTLQPVRDPLQRDAMLAVAAYFGSTRLIDNIWIRFAGGVPAVT